MAIDRVCEDERCTGCSGCYNVCPQNAISIVFDELGCAKPCIDSKLCISCHLCQNICPSENASALERANCCYAAWSTLETDIQKSSSRGIGAVFTRHILQNGGVVYGAVSESQMVHHKRFSTLSGIDELRGSKYVYSEIGRCYQEVKKILKIGIKVLFIGIPCQIDGLKHYRF